MFGRVAHFFNGEASFHDLFKTDQQRREEAIKEALTYFQFNQSDVRDASKFNKKILVQRYRTLARLTHPDVQGGSAESFLQLQLHYGRLLPLYEGMSQRTHDAEKVNTCLSDNKNDDNDQNCGVNNDNSGDNHGNIGNINTDDTGIDDISECKIDKYFVTKGLVLMISIASYDENSGLDGLNGTKMDKKNMIKLWKDYYGYQVLFNKNDRMDKADCVDLLNQWRNILSSKINKDKFDALFVIISCHGTDNCIIFSDGQKMFRHKLYQWFNGDNVPFMAN